MTDILSSLYQLHKESEDESDIIVIQDMVNDKPILHDFMRFTKFEGVPSEPPRLGYFVSDGKLYVSLSDSQRRRSLRVECSSFHNGCENIENHINQGALDSLWYNWPKNGKAPRKKP